MLHANLMALCVTETELLPIKVLHWGNRDFRPSLLPWPWTWPDYFHIRTWPVFHGDVQDERKWTSYVKARKLSDRQTYIRPRNDIPRRFAGGQLLIVVYSGYISRCVLVPHGHGFNGVTLASAAVFSAGVSLAGRRSLYNVCLSFMGVEVGRTTGNLVVKSVLQNV